MLTQLVALPLLLAATLDAPQPETIRPRVGASAAALGSVPQPPPVPSLESSPRLPEPVLRRTWCAEGSEATQAGASGPVGRGITKTAALALADGRIQRPRPRGPPRHDS
jgi:hypothetical protein